MHTVEISKDLTPLTREEIITAQAEDPFCKAIRRKIADGEEDRFFEDTRGYLSRISAQDRISQIILPEALRERALLLAHYPRLAGHPGGSRMYQTLRRTFYWPAMGLDV